MLLDLTDLNDGCTSGGNDDMFICLYLHNGKLKLIMHNGKLKLKTTNFGRFSS